MKKRSTIPRRQRFFVGCEGESEQGYATYLDRLANSRNCHIHIKAVNLQPAGSPIVAAKKAIAICKKEESKSGPFKRRAIMLDTDTLAGDLDLRNEIEGFLVAAKFDVIWQDVDHEAFLLRHFDGHQCDNPPSTQTLQRLQSVWATYRKGLPSASISREISIEHVRRACSVHISLASFLRNLGLVE